MTLRPLAAGLALLAAGCAGTPPRAAWVWSPESYAMTQDAGVADDAAAFFRAKDIGTLYLYADATAGRTLITRDPGAYRRLIRRLHRRGLRVHALLGSAWLRTEEYVLPERRPEALAMLQRVLDYNAAARADERFDGVSLDLEPHVLPQWREEKEQLLRHFLDTGRALMALKRAAGQDLRLGAAMPFWFDGIGLDWEGRRAPASEHVIGLFDYVALMAYRTQAHGADGLIANAASELAYAGRAGKRVVIGVEVTPNDDEPGTSFAGTREVAMERELSAVEQAFAGNPAFAGFAIHHYRSYRDWLDGGAPVGARP